MIPFFVDIDTTPSDRPLCMQEIRSIGMGYPDGSNDLTVEVLMSEDFKNFGDPTKSMVMEFRDRVIATGGASIGRTRASMLGVTLVGWGVRSRVWPRIAVELFRCNAPLYNFASPLSRRYNDVDMADLRMILTQGGYIESKDDMDFDAFMSYMGFGHRYAENGDCQYACDKTRMELRIRDMADLFGRYLSFSGKD